MGWRPVNPGLSGHSFYHSITGNNVRPASRRKPQPLYVPYKMLPMTTGRRIPNQVWSEPNSAAFSAPTTLSLTWKIPSCPRVTGSSQNADTQKILYGVISRSVCKACIKQRRLGLQPTNGYLITRLKMFQTANRRPLWSQTWSLQSFESQFHVCESAHIILVAIYLFIFWGVNLF